MYYPVAHANRLLQGIGMIDPDPSDTIIRQFQAHAERTARRTFLRYEDQRYSYGRANALANRYAHAYRALGIGKGDVVALILENRPEFLWHLFGLHKLGAVASLINTHLRGAPLAHALRICKPKHIVIGSEVWSTFADGPAQLPDWPPDMIDVDLDPAGPQERVAAVFGDRVAAASETNPPELANVRLSDQAAFIYTSGTTGLPKAAVVKHMRFFEGGSVWAGAAFMFRGGDVLYNCLPLYHSNALLLALSSTISAGVTFALARRFSRRRFWDDVRDHDANAFIYIGELCRYLMNNEVSARDREHHVRAISGNGLRPDIWHGFQRRFGVRRIVEFYGSTEGNAITLNVLGIPGSVGIRLPGMRLARWDAQRDDFARDPQGHLVRAGQDEPGVLLGRIRRRAQFEGYQDQAATESKIIRNAFREGDAWFNTGDLLRCKLRHLYFVDRLGDTFRWKGENVATSEVQEQLLGWPGVEEADVYGVEVPGREGRAGMAALVLAPSASFDPKAFRDFVASRLPDFAWPRFVRIVPSLATTSTFKVTKHELRKAGYNPNTLRDPLYVLDLAGQRYAPLTPELYASVVDGALPL